MCRTIPTIATRMARSKNWNSNLDPAATGGDHRHWPADQVRGQHGVTQNRCEVQRAIFNGPAAITRASQYPPWAQPMFFHCSADKKWLLPGRLSDEFDAASHLSPTGAGITSASLGWRRIQARHTATAKAKNSGTGTSAQRPHQPGNIRLYAKYGIFRFHFSTSEPKASDKANSSLFSARCNQQQKPFQLNSVAAKQAPQHQTCFIRHKQFN